jgi:hypothetical protein
VILSNDVDEQGSVRAMSGDSITPGFNCVDHINGMASRDDLVVMGITVSSGKEPFDGEL